MWEEICCCLVTQSCLTLCNPVDCRMQTSLSFTISWSLLRLVSIELVMPSSNLILCHLLLLLPSTFPNIRVFSNESALHIRWPKYWSFSIRPSNEYWKEIVPGFSTTVFSVLKKMSYTEQVLSKCLLNKAVCLQDPICIFYHKCWSKCFRFAFLGVYLPCFTMNPGGLCLNHHLYSSYLAPCLAPGRHSLSNEWKWKKKECKFLETWSSDNSVKTDDYINSLWSWVSNRGQNLGNLGPRTEAICSWTLRVHIVNGVPFLHCWGLGQSCGHLSKTGWEWTQWENWVGGNCAQRKLACSLSSMVLLNDGQWGGAYIGH